MTLTFERLMDRYGSLLQSYLVIKGETALQKAYEVGREALTEGMSLLELLTLHHEVLVKVLHGSKGHEKDVRALTMAGSFLREALSSFEMIQRGYQDTVTILREKAQDLDQANRRLSELNGTLEQRIKERTAALEEKAAELVRSNSELQQFVHVASHDLKEPIRNITSYVQLLQATHRGKLDPQADEYIQFAVEGTHRIRDLLDDLLAYTRLGAQALLLQRTDLTKVFGEALSNLRVSIAENQAVLSCAPLPVVQADASRMLLLFQNLLSNALKFQGDQGPRIHVFARREPGHWVVSVQDNGIGIDPVYAERIFELFQRLHSRDEYPGTGIGLSLCRKIVEQHGGKIWVEAVPGKGSTFSFTIPIEGGENELEEGRPGDPTPNRDPSGRGQ